VRLKAELQVLEAIVGLFSIDVVHCLVAFQRSAERLGHDDSVLRHVPASISHRRSNMTVVDQHEHVSLSNVPATFPMRMTLAPLAAWCRAESNGVSPSFA
jgi:hypothetical protein